MAVELGSEVQRRLRSVAADEWVSVADAARMLGTPPHRVENLIAHGHLVAATSPSDDLGTTGASIEREIVWRRETTWWLKARRAVGDAMNWI
jgi:crotonobetainyl-CoA:carnitine CoA-transferase CaiB-like acyl-CoA transferase